MDTNGASNTMNARVQPSIRSFFQPRQPSYTAPPAASVPASRCDPSLPPSTTSQTPSRKSASSLPEQAAISTITSTHVQPLRRINALLLPIHYPDSFYHNITSPDAPISFSRVITWTDSPASQPKVIGGVVCRLDPALAPDSTQEAPKVTEGAYDIYIQSLALLSPYRGKGLVAEALKNIIERATSQQELRIASLYAHVWTENEEALTWYAARGFIKEPPILHGYYRRLKPDTAHMFRRRLSPTDHLTQRIVPGPAMQQQATNTPPPSSACAGTGARPPISTARSFQDKGPEREWNDLPEDVVGNALLKPPSHLGSKEGSAASSRSSSTSRDKTKKKRVYPAAAFGS